MTNIEKTNNQNNEISTVEPTPETEHVGFRIRLRRILKGLSVPDLANELNISETTANNLEAGRFPLTFSTLEKITKTLDIPIEFLFQELDEAVAETLPDEFKSFCQQESSIKDEIAELIIAYQTIAQSDREKAQLLLKQVKTMAKQALNNFEPQSSCGD